MPKIYQSYQDKDQIKIEDYIDFEYGKFDTGIDGFGIVNSGNISCRRANYELQTLKSFREYIKRVKLEDGYVQDFVLFNPQSYQSLYERSQDLPKDMETYEKYSLNEEAIILFTNYVTLKNYNEEKVKRIFGRYLPTSMYLLLPGSEFTIERGSFNKGLEEKYEVLQSSRLGRTLTLNKINRLDLK